jgi:hypothetical protein
MKINFLKDEWITKFHRNGWRYVTEILSPLQNNQGIACYSWLDNALPNGIKHPWTGFLHCPISYPKDHYPERYKGRVKSLEVLIKQDFFKKSLDYCRGIFTLSETTKNFLLNNGVQAESLYHPCPQPSCFFSMNKYQGRVLHIGQMMRRHHDFIDLPASNKLLIKVDGHEKDYARGFSYSKTKEIIPYRNRCSEKEYDDLITSSVVFLSLYDASACNTLLECIMSNTPILLNPLPAVKEYIGNDYPLYFKNLDEAGQKIADLDQIFAAHKYLLKLDKTKFSGEKFFSDFVSSRTYQSLAFIKNL